MPTDPPQATHPLAPSHTSLARIIFDLPMPRVFILLILTLVGCTAVPTADPIATPIPASGKITLVHINDVYEITPLAGGASGGLARVAALVKEFRRRNPNTIFTLGGDFFSPSALGTAVVQGQRLAGRQMVAVLNSAGLDLAVFGNHEFDLRPDEFMARLSEASFPIIATNVTDTLGNRFSGTVPYAVRSFAFEGADTVKIGFLGSVLPSNPQPWVRYLPWFEAMQTTARLLRDSVDILIGLTHLSVDQDAAIAESLGLDLIIGGHEHDNMILRRGPGLTPIVKADANVRTIAVVDLFWDRSRRQVQVTPNLMAIGDTLPDDPDVAKTVAAWVDLGYAGFRAGGFEPDRVIANLPMALEGRESQTRNQPTNLASLIAEAFYREAGDVDLALVNTGSIRIDDVIPPGPIVEYDLIRILPFGGNVAVVTMLGEVLEQVLNQGDENRGTGGYLAHYLVRKDPSGRWLVGGLPIVSGNKYRVALTDYLASGRERGLGFLSPSNPGITDFLTFRDVRLALKDELSRKWPAP